MLCDLCKKTDATVHLTQIVEGKVMKVDLCENCSKNKGVQDTAAFSLADLLVGLGGTEESKGEKVPGLKCAACGLSQEDFKKTGRLGCAVCWETFAQGLGSLLKAMHKSELHTGKVPSKAAHTVVLTEQIKTLNMELQKAVQAENYEEAARIRDQVRALESKLKAGVPA